MTERKHLTDQVLARMERSHFFRKMKERDCAEKFKDIIRLFCNELSAEILQRGVNRSEIYRARAFFCRLVLEAGLANQLYFPQGRGIIEDREACLREQIKKYDAIAQNPGAHLSLQYGNRWTALAALFSNEEFRNAAVWGRIVIEEVLREEPWVIFQIDV